MTVSGTTSGCDFPLRNRKCLENSHPETSEQAHTSAERFRKAKTKQRKSNKPASHQADRNIAKRASKRPASLQPSQGPAARAKPLDNNKNKHAFQTVTHTCNSPTRTQTLARNPKHDHRLSYLTNFSLVPEVSGTKQENRKRIGNAEVRLMVS